MPPGPARAALYVQHALRQDYDLGTIDGRGREGDAQVRFGPEHAWSNPPQGVF